MMSLGSSEQLAAEAREALRRAPESPEQHFYRLVKKGFINARGQVTRLLGGDVEPESVDHGGPSPDRR